MCHQTVTVGQKEDILHPAVLKQYITQSDNSSRLAGTGSHNQQSLAAIARKGITGCFDCTLLIVAPCNAAVHHNVFQTCSHTLEIKQLFQISLGINCSAPAFRIDVISNARLKAVRQKDDRTTVVLLFQQISIQFCLLSSFSDIYASALSLHHRQWTAIIAVEYIVRTAHLTLIGHTGQFHLVPPAFTLSPACISEHSVDIQLTGLIFRQIKWLGHIGLLLHGTTSSELFFQCGILCHECRQINLRRPLHRNSRHFGGLCQQITVKMSLGIVFTVTICYEIQKYIEVFQTQRRLLLGDLFSGMGGVIAHTANKIHSPPDVRTHNITEILGVHKADKRILIRHGQCFIHGIHPLHSELHRPATVQHTGRGVDM